MRKGDFFKKIVNSHIKFIGKIREARIQEKLLYLDVSGSISESVSVWSVGNKIRFKWTRYEMKGVDTDSSLKKFAGNRTEDGEKREVFDWFLCRSSTIK